MVSLALETVTLIQSLWQIRREEGDAQVAQLVESPNSISAQVMISVLRLRLMLGSTLGVAAA